MGSTSGPLTTAIQWGESAVHLKDYAGKHNLPGIVKVTKGQYRNIGVAKSVQSELYLHSVKASKKVLAEGIKIKDSKKATINTLEQKYSLPVSYQGWFELLSENGKAIRAIQTVQELARIGPQRCLVREGLKAYTAKDNGEVASDKTRSLLIGEQLTLIGEVGVGHLGRSMGKKRLLKCTDSKGETVFLPFDQKGVFSPIAGQGNISGVHNVKGLLEKFRFPVIVRLVHGIIPSKLEKNTFTGIFRLLSIYKDETAFVCPLKKDCKMVPISTREPLKLISCQNFQDIRDLDETKYYHQRSAKMISSYMNSIHVLVNPPDPTSFEQSKDESVKSVWHDAKNKETITPVTPNSPVSSEPVSLKSEEDILFEEVDDIYQYVRDGGKPPPPRPRPPSFHAHSSPGSPDSNHLIHPGSPTTASASSPLFGKNGSQGELNKQDDNYWEEPIYDEIEKYKKKKHDHDLVSAGITVKVAVQKNGNVSDKKIDDVVVNDMYKSDPITPPTPSTPSPPSPVTPPPEIPIQNSTTTLLTRSATRLSTEPVENLRQLYKLNMGRESDGRGSRPSSQDTPDMETSKRFDSDSGSNPRSNPGSLEELIGSPVMDFRASDMNMVRHEKDKKIPRKNSSTSLSTNVSNIAIAPGGGSNSVNVTLGIPPPMSTPVNSYNSKVISRSQPGSASIMVKSSNTVSSNHVSYNRSMSHNSTASSNNLVYNRSHNSVVHKNRISFSSPQSSGMKYVAVARVGEEPETRNNYDHRDNYNHSKLDNVNKHIQSMYL